MNRFLNHGHTEQLTIHDLLFAAYTVADVNPNDAMSHYFLGAVLRRAGRAKEAIPWGQKTPTY